mgnify:CR=1 FL=1
MTNSIATTNRWRVPYGRNGRGHWEGSLQAYWEVDLDPVSDDYSPRETSADYLLDLWARQAGEKHETGLIPIYWFVQSEDAAKFESLPFAYDHFGGEFASTQQDFLWHYGWPVNVSTGEPLNWCDLPVIDKLWNEESSDKGGFIQEATGWKPSIGQPFVYLPTLLKCRQR